MCKSALGTGVDRHFKSVQHWLAVAQADEDRSGYGGPSAIPHFVGNFVFEVVMPSASLIKRLYALGFNVICRFDFYRNIGHTVTMFVIPSTRFACL